MASSCVLRVTGDDFQPHVFLQDSNLEPCNIFHKGEQRSAKSKWNNSGVTFEISSKDDFSAQIQDAVVFLQTNRAELLRLMKFAGIEETSVDFGINAEKKFVQSYIFPLEIIHLASELKLELEVSIYEAS